MNIQGILGAGRAPVSDTPDEGASDVDADAFAAVLAEHAPTSGAEGDAVEQEEEDDEAAGDEDALTETSAFDVASEGASVPALVDVADAMPTSLPIPNTVESVAADPAGGGATPEAAALDTAVQAFGADPSGTVVSDELSAEAEAGPAPLEPAEGSKPSATSMPKEDMPGVSQDGEAGEPAASSDTTRSTAVPRQQATDAFVRDAHTAARLATVSSSAVRTPKGATSNTTASSETVSATANGDMPLDGAPRVAAKSSVEHPGQLARSGASEATVRATEQAPSKGTPAQPTESTEPEATEGAKQQTEEALESAVQKREATPSPRPTAPTQQVRARRAEVDTDHVDTHREIDAMLRGKRQRAATSAVNQMTLRHAASADVELPDLGHIRIDARSIAGEVDVDVRTVETSTASVLQSVSASIESELRNTSIELRNLDIREESSGDATPQRREAGAEGDANGQRGQRSDTPARAPIIDTTTRDDAPAGRVRIVL